MKRFWTKVAVGRKCWLWLAAKDRDGYGQFKLNGHQVKAHRVSWTLKFGPIPDDIMVLHKCDNPSCVKPAHLFLGSGVVNVRDCMAKGRRANLKGSQCPWAFFSRAQVCSIRKQALRRSCASIARLFKVRADVVERIVNLQTYKIDL